MNPIFRFVRSVAEQLWGKAPDTPRVWNDRAERDRLDPLDRWVILR